MHLRESDSLPLNLRKEPLQGTAGFTCSQEKKKAETHSTHSGSTEKAHTCIAEVEHVWTNYFAPMDEGEGRDAAEEGLGSNEERSLLKFANSSCGLAELIGAQ